ncbi:hypothetical protein R3P38DRAFT_2616730 [Favolaschia claudopus]|uniref:Integral membrane protein n=1 Tax=Favolaschia claudopus TaxID=2862362 RepID=A0AAW0CBT7_9AGAR
MPSGDLATQLIGIVSLWAATVLYGINLVMFIICAIILLKRRTAPGENIAWYLLGGICLQFCLSTAHVGVALGAGVHAFKTMTPATSGLVLLKTWISPLGKFTNLQQLFYAINNFVGDSILIWRLFVVYGSNWYICILPALLACASAGCTLYAVITTFLNPALILRTTTSQRGNSFGQTVTAGFALTATTQILVTLLLAARIVSASRSFDIYGGGQKKQFAAYSSLLWMLVESGAAISFTEIIFLGVWRSGYGGLSQLLLAMLGQLCAIVPLSIVCRVGLRLAFEGNTSKWTLPASSGGNPSKGSSSATLQFRARPGKVSNANMDKEDMSLGEFKAASTWGQSTQLSEP